MHLRKLLITIFLLFAFQGAYAGVFDFLSCLPCGCSDLSVVNSDGSYSNKESYPWCPPYNKKNRPGCLSKTYPGSWEVWYSYTCAESTNTRQVAGNPFLYPDAEGFTSFFEPKIKVRNQTCFFGCWTKDTMLKGDGECVVWPGPIGIPLNRICARIAFPALVEEKITRNPDGTITTTSNNIIDADPGWSEEYINRNGYWKPDPKFMTDSGESYTAYLPKICAYEDPSLVTQLTGQGINEHPDTLDLDLMKQPFHNTPTTHPIIALLIVALDNGLDIATVLSAASGAAFDKMGAGGVPLLSEFASIIDVIVKLVPKDTLIAILRDIGQMNKVVLGGPYGCLNLALGPFPKPYCDELQPPEPVANITPICRVTNEIDSSGKPIVETSTRNKPCVKLVGIENNLVNNKVRVGFQNILERCKSDASSQIECVKINANSASSLHVGSGYKDVIPQCGGGVTNNCVDISKAPVSCTNSSECINGFKVVYGVRSGEKITRVDAYPEDMQDCATPTAPGNMAPAACLDIYGVNLDEYVDIPINFPAIETSLNTVMREETRTIKDKNGSSRSFTAYIPRQPQETVGSTSFSQNQICVFENLTPNPKLVGCVERAQAPTPKVYQCGDSAISSSITCSTDHFQPKMVIQMKSGSSATSGVVEATNVHNNAEVDKLNLAGFDFSAFVTDPQFNKVPFKDTRPPSVTMKWGNYVGGGQPYQQQGSNWVPTGAKYLSGMEYDENGYVVGGSQICAKSSSEEACSENKQNCVLTKLKNTNIVKCEDFLTKRSKYPGLKICSSSESSSCPMQSDGFERVGGGTLQVRKCSPSNLPEYYCYDSNVELCDVSFELTDRITPAFNGSNAVLTKSQYFDPANTYDKNTTVVRDKTQLEQGMCVSIPTPPGCSAVTDASAGDAAWPAAASGYQATGVCPPDKLAMSDMNRYCLLDKSTKTASFESRRSDQVCANCNFDVEIRNWYGDLDQVATDSLKIDRVNQTIEFSDPSTRDTWGKGWYYYSVTLHNIDTKAITSFYLSDVTFEDGLKVYVNGIDPITDIIFDDWYGGGNRGKSQSYSYNASNAPNIKAKLVDGTNYINFSFNVVGAGNLYYKLKYKCGPSK